MNKEKIYFFRYIVMPVALSWLANGTYGSVGEQDRGDFEKDFNEILDLAQSALEDETLFDAISREKAIGVINDGRLTKLIDADVAIDSIKRLPHVKPEITQDQLEEYCKKRCLTVITDDLFYKLTSGSENTATLATMPSAVSPHNETYTKFIDELLAYEERNDMFNLTTKERAEFQSYVRERMEL